ncbi:MAG: hypothetical protein ACXVB9_18270 [Bdellovibrionota bacterium]
MKLRLLTLCILFSACAKDKGTTTSTAAQAATTPACPMFDGHYVGQDTDGSSVEFVLHSKASGSSVSYSVADDGAFIPADGAARRTHTDEGDGSITVSCNANSLTMEMHYDGKDPMKLIFNQESFTSIRLDANYGGEKRETVLTKKS